MEKLTAEIRAIAISSKGGISVNDLRRDFLELGGSDKMYQGLGFKTLAEFVNTRPKEFIVRNGLVFAQLKEESLHIQKLVNQQGGKAKRPGRLSAPTQMRRPGGRGGNYSRPSSNYSRPRYPPVANTSSYPRANVQRFAAARPPTTSIARDQPVTRDNTSYRDQPAIRDNTSYRDQPATRDNSSYRDQPATRDNSSYRDQPATREQTAHSVARVQETRTVYTEPGKTGDDVCKLMIRKTWPRELFVNKSAASDSSRRSAANHDHDDARQAKYPPANSDTELGGAIPFTRFKAKEPPSREPYRHVSDALDLGDGDVFEIAPPLHDSTVPSQPLSNGTGLHPMAPTAAQPRAAVQPSRMQALPSMMQIQSSLSQIPPSMVPMQPHPTQMQPKLTPLQSNLMRAQVQVPVKHTVPPPVTNGVISKKPAADRIARLQARTAQVKEEEAPKPAKMDIHERLRSLCLNHGLPEPEIQMLSSMSGTRKAYTCLVKAGGQLFSSEVPTTDAATAENLTISNAYMTLSGEWSVPQPPTPAITLKEDSTPVFLAKLRQMVQKSTGLWLEMIPMAYQNLYSASLPTHWKEAVCDSDAFSTSFVLGKQLLYLAPPGADVSAVNSSKADSDAPLPDPTNGTSHAKEPERVSAPSPPAASAQPGGDVPSRLALADAARVPLPKSPEATKKRKLPPLETPDNEYWDIYILSANDPGELVCRIIGDSWSDKQNELIEQLELEMLGGGKQVTDPEVGECYAVPVPGGCLRAILQRILPNGKADVYFIDEGDDDVVELSQLRHLEDKYFELAPQALRLSINGLETFPDVQKMRKIILDQLLRRVCICHIMKMYPEQMRGIRACVVLWDTTTAVDININSWLMEQVVASLHAPSLTEGATREMLVSHVGDGIYLQANDKNLQCIACLIDYTVNRCEDSYSVDNIVFNKVYLARNLRSGTYQRAKIMSASGVTNGDKLSLRFIDYGTTSSDSLLEDLLDVERMCKALAIAAPQAIEVIMSNVQPLTPKKLIVARHTIPVAQIVVVKVQEVEAGVPRVEIYHRDPVDQTLRSVNNILNAALRGEPISEQSPTGLPAVKLPPIGSLVFITVTLSFSPNVFTVQLMEHYDATHELMYDLQAAELPSAPALDLAALQSGGHYAVLYDSSWYRGQLTAIIDTEALPVRLCDYGNLIVTSLDNLRALPMSFLQLPSQALRATLAGAVPVNGDWSPADCVFFQELVVDKNMAGYLTGIKQGMDGPVLELRLVDTSHPEDDVDVVNLLVERGIAVLAQ